jgi:hypothetical protein
MSENDMFKFCTGAYKQTKGYKQFKEHYAKDVEEGWDLLSVEVPGQHPDNLRDRIAAFEAKGLEVKIGYTVFGPEGKKIEGGKALLFREKPKEKR